MHHPLGSPWRSLLKFRDRPLALNYSVFPVGEFHHGSSLAHHPPFGCSPMGVTRDFGIGPVAGPRRLWHGGGSFSPSSGDRHRSGNRCKGLIAQSVKLPRDRALEAAVGRVLIQATASNGETFDLRHYRFSLDTSRRESTIDLRLNPETRRRFQSLSSCEQLTLFGSVQATLTRNRHWPIDRVIFTDNGQRLDW
ncbi:MAG: hypothetical protein EA001_00570 [Oscillatoriales cyanobacterium]|nr:MAG: hypothetical protein EA001_00570 [Oscillatoriales cyanobacterium]